MTSLLLQFAISNLLLSVPLALIAYAVHRSQRSPTVAHLLWVLVLAKLVTPPIFSVSLDFLPNISTQAASAIAQGTKAPLEFETDLALVKSNASIESGRVAWSDGLNHSWIAFSKTCVFALWISGGLFVLLHSLNSVFRFNRRLRVACRQVDPDLQRLATEVAEQLGLRWSPKIYSVPAEISPLVWWIGGRVRVVIPGRVRQQFAPDEIKLILAHELAHIKRCDHLVRWLEWLACVVFWWNPVVWWSRRCLRVNEELCCDAMVLRALHPEPQRYGFLLLTIIELLSSPEIRPPAEACAIDSGGSLERRFRMIVSMNTVAPIPRWLSGGMLALAMGLLPLGIAYAQDFDAFERRLGAAVSDGEINLSQAQAMMRALRATSGNHQLEKLKAGIEQRLRHVGEELRKRVAAGEITQKQMEGEYEAAERKMWTHYREAELKHHRQERNHVENEDLEKLKAGIEQRLRHVGEELRKRVAAGEITQKQMEGEYEVAERKMWTYYREAELKHHRQERNHVENEDLEKLKAGIEQRLRHVGEELRKRVAAGEITQKQMEGEYEAAERKMWTHYREAELKHHRQERNHVENEDLEKLKAGIEQRLRHVGEELRKRVAAGEITQKQMEGEYEVAERKMWTYYRKAKMQGDRGKDEHVENQDALRERYMYRIREIEEAMKSGEISPEEGARAIEETKRGMEKAVRDRKETSSSSSSKDDARQNLKTKDVEPRFVPEEEYTRVEAELKEQVTAGKNSEKEVSRELTQLQNANNMAHIEKSVREGEMTRAEADELYAKLGIK